jgi:protein phosphatase
MMDCGLLSIKGKVRENDEDSIICMNISMMNEGKENTVTLAAVADGMGGGEKGEFASKYAIQRLVKSIIDIFLDGDLSSDKIKQAFSNSVSEANEFLKEYKRNNNIKMIGTTLTAVLINIDTMYVMNIGDSRTYLISKDGKIKKKTKDHSFVQKLVDEGFLDESNIRTHPQRNIVTRVIDGTDDSVPDFYEWRIYKGDTIVLCCDGLWEPLEDKVIGKTVSSGMNLQETVKLMVDTANTIDGSDNISAVILRQVEGQDEEPLLKVATRKLIAKTKENVSND